MVMDARTGEVLHSRNADTRLHPASLTKMMTLYIVFEAVKHGELDLDQKIRISKKAAAEPPSKLGLRAGQRIALRYLIRAAAVKSANDAATALGEAVSGSEAAFARRMNRTAKALGMSRTTFKNAHGLTESGHLSTARDMTTLGRHLFYDYPEYYNLFSRRSTDAGIKAVYNTNRRFLAAYRGADGIKTGYTRAAGFNLVSSAQRGEERIIATMFGGSSTAARNKRVAELLDMGFKRAPTRAAVRKPRPPAYVGNAGTKVAEGATGKTIRLVTAVSKSMRPLPRPTLAIAANLEVEPPSESAAASLKTTIQDALQEAIVVADGSTAVVTPEPRPEVTKAETIEASQIAEILPPAVRPDEKEAIKETLLLAAVTPEVHEIDDTPVIVTKISNTSEKFWGVNVGNYASRYAAERALLKTALRELATLDGTDRKAVKTSKGFEANFTGMSREAAELACRRLAARNTECSVISPS
ncbi:D-alanyl-D-alanine carboxypeptidase [Halocynthiibacter sp. SDUM655004]|uniref:D-alanyl-D-alanine carboxypeptidase n=2 Tax=Paracoccaceae TaxID=31989 RepID=A0AAE3LQB1_9RHOB|nr:MULTISPECIES: D-alanyl-D-alanine carboxypeptidase family protein [Halocynthiibacter]MCV6823349.1 D-alanyl-D-alanine carboxypeptidase [Halocynthiibacter halioticoli]MCW4056350.1 D-alanyl-D-alanine carboxypeptidase [Halocynthiibacter sp. SDUM655004]MDE0590684.1 D-alanyl-D-alanine carboxypeptidase [Halocynthiibacter sp. C4]